jgi:FkbH-like protein
MSAAVLPPGKSIKLVVWGVTRAPWNGAVMAALDERGVMQSAVAGGDAEAARAALAHAGIDDWLLAPQLGVADRAAALRAIAAALNLGLDATLVIDDDPEARRELAAAHPAVRVVGSDDVAGLLGDSHVGPSLVGVEPRPRRLLYREELARAEAQRSFLGPPEAFAAMLEMHVTLAPAAPADLPRLRELANRANPGCTTYRDDELVDLCSSQDHALIVGSLVDRFGDCGQVGLVLIERAAATWALRLFQFSCRVQARGVPRAVLSRVLSDARAAGVRVIAELVPTSRNRPIAESLERAGFQPIDRRGDAIVVADEGAELPTAVGITLTCAPELFAGPRRAKATETDAC